MSAILTVAAILCAPLHADTVTDIAGLRLWLDAGDLNTIWSDTGGTSHPGDGGAVARWDDKSGLGFNVTQSNSGNQPTYQSAALNGQSTLYFDNDNLGRANDIGITGNADRTVITVWTGATNNGMNYQHSFHMGNSATDEAYGHSVYRGSNGLIGNHYWSSGFDTTAAGSSAPTMAVSMWDGDGGSGANGLDSWWVGGSDVGTYERAALSTASNSLLIGSRLAPQTEGIRGSVAEVIVYDRLLTPTEHNEIGWYLSQKWGLATTYVSPIVPGATLTWDGSVNNWGTLDPNSHWTGGSPTQIPQISGNVADDAIVNAGAMTVAANRGANTLTVNGGSVTVGAGNTLQLVRDLNVSTGAAFTLGAGSRLEFQGGSAVGIAATGDTTFKNNGTFSASHLVLAPGATFTKEGVGKVSFDQSAGSNVIGATNTVRVTQGELWMQAASNPIGGAGLDLNGGTFTVQGAIASVGDALGHHGFHVNSDSVALNLNNNGGVVNGNPPSPKTYANYYGSAVLTSGPDGNGLEFDDDSEFIATGAIGQVDNYSNLWLGKLHVDAGQAGNWTFRHTRSDDIAGIWIDLDRDGVFELTGSFGDTGGGNNQKGELISYEDDNDWKTVSLAAGDYLFAVTHREGGGGSNIEVQFQSPAMSSGAIVNPGSASQAGLWSFEQIGAIAMGDTDVTVHAGSTLNMLTDQTASLGALSFATNSALTTRGAVAGIFFTGTTFSAGGGRFTTLCDTNPGVISDGGNGVTIAKNGSGRLIVDQAASISNAASFFDVQEGTLVLVGPNPIGSTVVRTSGGTLALTAGAAASEPFDLPVQVAADSNLTAGQHAGGQAGPKTVVLGSGANGISLTGGWLRVSTTDSYALTIAGSISGSGGIQFLDGSNVTISTAGNFPARVGVQTTANVTGLLTNLQATGGYYLDPTSANPTFTFNQALGSNGADSGAELHIGNDDTVEGLVVLGGANTYSGKTRIARGALQATEGVNLPTGSRIEFDSNNRDQAAVLLTNGTFTRNIGTGAGEVSWSNSGGFAARGGDLAVTLEGGAQLSWTSSTVGFNNRDSVQLGSRYADSMVELTNDIDLAGSGDRRFQVQDNRSVGTDFVRISGAISGGSASNQLRFNESSGNDFNWALVELTGGNTYLNATRIDDVTLYAIEGQGLPVNSLLRFEGNDDNRPAVLMSNGTMARNIGTAAGEVRWDSRGGFAARGGPFTVTLEGGAQLNWGDGNAGFNGQLLYLGSDYADSRVEITNDIDLAGSSTTDRHVRTIDNRQTNQDVGLLSGVISGPSRLVRNDNDDYAGTIWLAPSGGRVNTYTGDTRLDDGILRAVDGVGLSSASHLMFDADGSDRPSVLESSGTFTRAIGTGAGQVRWENNAGGFAAWGGPLTVNLFGDGRTIPWDANAAGGGLNTRYLQLGSPTADNVVDWTNGLSLNGSHRTIRVFDNPYSDQDVSKISGVIANGPSGSYGINVDGGRDAYGYGGTLWLAGPNTFPDRIDINDGVLRGELGVGIPNTSRIYLGGHSAARPAIFESSGSFTRNIGGGSGEVNWGNSGGGFAAWGGPLTVALESNVNMNWGDGGTGLGGNRSLMLGSPTANDTVTFANSIQLRGDRTVQLFNNFYSAGDYAVMSGVISNGDSTARQLIVRGDPMLPGYNATDPARGVLELSNVNTYTGDTHVYDGARLVVTGSVNTAGGRLYAHAGTTLAGTGTIGQATIEGGAVVSPGMSVGTLTAGYLTLKAGSVYEWELTPTGQDQINTFELTLEPGSVLRVLMSQTMDLAPTARYPVFGVGGQLFGVLDEMEIDLSAIDTGSYFLWDPAEARLEWDVQDQMVYLTGLEALVNEPPSDVIPEPATLLGLAAGLSAVGGYLRRRRNRR